MKQNKQKTIKKKNNNNQQQQRKMGYFGPYDLDEKNGLF